MSFLCFDMFKSQIVDHHISTRQYPAPAEPHHLALVCPRHGVAGGPVALAATQQGAHVDQRARIALVARATSLATPEEQGNHGGTGIEEAGVLTQDADRGEGVHVNGRRPVRPRLEQRRDEGPRAVVEGDVVRVGGHARLVKGYEDVDGGGESFVGVGCGGVVDMRRKCAAEQHRYAIRVPGRGHGVGEVSAAHMCG